MQNVLPIDGEKPLKMLIFVAQCNFFVASAAATAVVSIEIDSEIEKKSNISIQFHR